MKAVLIVLLAGVLLAVWIWRRHSASSRTQQMQNIQRFVFPPSIAGKVRESYPHLTEAQTTVVMNGLREYFLISLMAGSRMVSMPSKAVDTAWHEFILFTRAYQQFCNAAFGRFLHHTPAEAMRTPTQAQEGIKRAWRLACKREDIQPAAPRKLPLLFAVDQMLSIPGGYKYSLNCLASPGSDYCASHIACASGCSGSSSDSGCAGDGGSADSGSGDGGSSGGDGGGCGGD